jgi:DNA-directed RNA polymerase specialized sigma24 family protein
VAKQMPAFKYDRSKGTFKGWLQKTTRWKILAQLRKRRGNQQFEENTPLLDEEGEEAKIDAGVSDLEARWQEEWERNLMEVALERVKRQVRPREFQVFDFCTVKEWPVAKVAGHLNLIRPQVYYLNKKVARVIRDEIEKLREEVE